MYYYGPVGFGAKNDGSVSVILRTGVYKRVLFRGFIEVGNVSGLSNLMILDVIDLPQQRWTLG
jgi:hypothetical protein